MMLHSLAWISMPVPPLKPSLSHKTPPRATARRPRFSRRNFSKLLAILTTVPLPATAICGEPDPAFTHYLNWNENVALLSGRQIHYRVVGNKRKETKAGKFPVLYLGDAGVALQSGEPFELLGGVDRRVVTADFLGVGQSSPLESLENAEGLGRDEATAVLQAAGIAKEKGTQMVHVVAAGFGLRVADALLQEEQSGWSVASVAAEGWGIARDVSFPILQGERICAVEGAQDGSVDIMRTLNGRGSEKKFLNSIKNIANKVPVIALQTRDLPRPNVEMDGFKLQEFEASGRLAHLEQTERTMEVLDKFFESVEKSFKDRA